MKTVLVIAGVLLYLAIGFISDAISSACDCDYGYSSPTPFIVIMMLFWPIAALVLLFEGGFVFLWRKIYSKAIELKEKEKKEKKK